MNKDIKVKSLEWDLNSSQMYSKKETALYTKRTQSCFLHIKIIYNFTNIRQQINLLIKIESFPNTRLLCAQINTVYSE